MANELSKPKKGEAANDAGAADERDPSKMPTKAAVKDLEKNIGALNQRASKIRGEIGAAIKAAEADENVHRGAFKAAMKERAMEPDERANYQRHLAKYRRDMGIELQGDLLKDAPKATGGGPGK